MSDKAASASLVTFKGALETGWPGPVKVMHLLLKPTDVVPQLRHGCQGESSSETGTPVRAVRRPIKGPVILHPQEDSESMATH